jgi:hypothetical protein
MAKSYPHFRGIDKEQTMTDLAKRLAALNAQKGTALHAVTQDMGAVLDRIEQFWDTNEPRVKTAVQHIEQALGALKTAAPEGYVSDQPAEGKPEEEPPATDASESRDQEAPEAG